jgi:transcriptional regulator with XRE-family HTH domain
MQEALWPAFLKTIHDKAYATLIAGLRDARKRRGISQVDLAKRIGRQQSHVSKLERGERRLDVLEYVVVARAIGVDPCEPLRKLALLISFGRGQNRSSTG